MEAESWREEAYGVSSPFARIYDGPHGNQHPYYRQTSRIVGGVREWRESFLILQYPHKIFAVTVKSRRRLSCDLRASDIAVGPLWPPNICSLDPIASRILRLSHDEKKDLTRDRTTPRSLDEGTP